MNVAVQMMLFDLSGKSCCVLELCCRRYTPCVYQASDTCYYCRSRASDAPYARDVFREAAWVWQTRALADAFVSG